MAADVVFSIRRPLLVQEKEPLSLGKCAMVKKSKCSGFKLAPPKQPLRADSSESGSLGGGVDVECAAGWGGGTGKGRRTKEGVTLG